MDTKTADTYIIRPPMTDPQHPPAQEPSRGLGTHRITQGTWGDVLRNPPTESQVGVEPPADAWPPLPTLGDASLYHQAAQEPSLPVVAFVWNDIGKLGGIERRISLERPVHVRREDLQGLADWATALAALRSAQQRAEAAEAEMDALKHQVGKLQAALFFWLPSAPPMDGTIADRIADDAMLLCGDVEFDMEVSAESAGWITLNDPPKEPTP